MTTFFIFFGVIFMLVINWKQIYEFNLNNNKQWILILYDISQNHYVGVPVYNEEKEDREKVLT